MIINYACDKCGYELSNESMSSFICKLHGCDGNMKLLSGMANLPTPFNAGWDGTLKCHVSSWSDQEKKARNHRSKAHPEGFIMIQDDKKRMKELRDIRKNRGDYLKATLPGYRHGEEKKRYDENCPDIDRSGKRTYSFA